MKRKIFRWISINIFGTKQGLEHPKWLLILFFPIQYYAIGYSGIAFDFTTGVYTIEGIRFSESVFINFAMDLEMGSYFRFVQRENETVYIERIENLPPT